MTTTLPTSRTFDSRTKPFFLLSPAWWAVLAALLGLGPWWLSSREMWDGVIGSYALALGDEESIRTWLLDSNWFVTFTLFKLATKIQQLFSVPVWFAIKLMLCLLALGLAYETTRLARDLLGLPREVAVWCAPLVLSFPIWYVFFSYTSMLGHLTCVWLGIISWRFMHGTRRWQNCLGGVGLLVCFQLASMCSFIIALEALLWWRWRVCPRGHALPRPNPYVTIFAVCAAVSVFVLTRLKWPPGALYAGYNQLLSPLVLANWLTFAKYAAMFVTWSVVVIPSATLAAVRYRHDLHSVRSTPCGTSQTIIALFFLAAAACAPYIAVGASSPLFLLKTTSDSSLSGALASTPGGLGLTVWYGGWGARHSLLLMLVLTLAAASFVAQAAKSRMALKVVPEQPDVPPDVWANAPLISIFGALCVMFNLLWLLPGHWAKLERLAQEQTLVAWLSKQPALPPGKVNFILPATSDFSGLMYEANSLLFRAYQQDHWAAVLTPDRPSLLAWANRSRDLQLSLPAELWPKVASQNLMKSYNRQTTCLTTAKFDLPKLSSWDVLWRAEHNPDALPKISKVVTTSNCPAGTSP